ncbi:group III truncated hemoglobin [Flavobacterium sp. Fl-77]|uniref:Group III truncated hemoglobin n=1 Tax=Flavobacterium flavipigmentatum TaxID=2893884 RepID=A0AAJ2S855_9FLAO|nr:MULTISPECIES: group III truncated hemoglobin [unclassified Flavobacterium]MDX6182441.1 group III truncated hemoglobin [Flavobacterium sp. Fl-33]MDX6185646.1 group III truncated hemoglobin [Flavobacterium sp. Fl-77]UFH38831.1 group III truncated hemoglobin [Flavobacterium sp. F-70]
MDIKEDIKTEENIKTLIYAFYDIVRKDELLSPIFNEVIKKDWDTHLETMCRFWSTMLLYSRTYKGDPMSKHIPLILSNEHFERWFLLFTETVDKLFQGKTANDAKRAAENIGRIMQKVKGINTKN